MSVSCLPHYTFASEKYLEEVKQLKSGVVEGEAETPATDVARLVQQVGAHDPHGSCRFYLSHATY